MNDLIDRNEALKEIYNRYGAAYEWYLEHGISGKEIEMALTSYAECHVAIKRMPSAEPKRGKWKRHPESREFDVCTACGFGCKRREYGLMPDGEGVATEWMTEYSYQYCPWCGAKMEVSE